MSRPRTQIRLAQPPIYLMGAVVLAALLPLFVQLSGGASHGVERLRRLAFAGIDVEQVETRELAVVSVVEEEVEAEEEIEIFGPEPLAETVAPARPPKDASRRAGSITARAEAACAKKDKASARAAYESLERGDPRRKTIRRSCRASGVWFL